MRCGMRGKREMLACLKKDVYNKRRLIVALVIVMWRADKKGLKGGMKDDI